MSNQWKKYLTAVVLALMPATAAYSGEGYGFIKHDVAPLVPLEIRIKKVDGNMSLRNDSLSIPIQYEAGYKGLYSYLVAVDLRVEHISKGNGALYPLRQNLGDEGKDKVWGTTTISLNRSHIEPMEKLGKELCASHTGNQDKRIDTVMPLTMHVTYYDDHAQRKFAKQTIVPLTIICEPNRPSNPAKLLQVKLGITAQQCHKPISLVALFAATLPANYKFKLQRGDGETQDASVFPAQKDGPFYRGQWGKVYTFNASETRKYRIVSENFAPLTDWVTISVQCPIGQEVHRPKGFINPQRPHVPQANPKTNANRPLVQPRVPSHINHLRRSAR